MKPSQRIVAYVLQKAEQEPVLRRASLYRDLATLVLSEDDAKKLSALAHELELIEKRTLQLRLDLGDRSAPPAAGGDGDGETR